jgi:hypothetical protein
MPNHTYHSQPKPFPMPSTRRTLLPLALVIASVCQALAADAPTTLIPQLEPFRPYIGKTWRGEFKNSTQEKPIIDVSRWERALNGQAIRTLHSINRGEYGGESIITWDAAKKSLVFHYFTTAGFITIGTVTFSEGRMISHEKVTGEAGGVTEVRSTNEILPDGSMSTKSEYLKSGQWEPGHAAVYREDPKAEVVFK